MKPGGPLGLAAGLADDGCAGRLAGAAVPTTVGAAGAGCCAAFGCAPGVTSATPALPASGNDRRACGASPGDDAAGNAAIEPLVPAEPAWQVAVRTVLRMP